MTDDPRFDDTPAPAAPAAEPVSEPVEPLLVDPTEIPFEMPAGEVEGKSLGDSGERR